MTPLRNALMGCSYIMVIFMLTIFFSLVERDRVSRAEAKGDFVAEPNQIRPV